MIIDFHVHTFPAEIRDHRERFFDDEPEFKLLYESPKSKLVAASDIIDMMDDQGVDMSVVFGFPWRTLDTCRRNNDYVIDAVNRYPDRLRGLCCVDSLNPNAVQEVERCLDAGLSGVGELAFYGCGIDGECQLSLGPIMAICRERDVPVLLHTNEEVGHLYPGKTPNTMIQIYETMARFPENTIVLAHWGGGLFISSEDHARVGLLVAREGAWNGAAVLDAGCVREVLRPCPINPEYGCLWWLNTGGAWLPGAPACDSISSSRALASSCCATGSSQRSWGWPIASACARSARASAAFNPT